jgi:hypothetical protein
MKITGSSTIADIDYNAIKKLLTVIFHGGGTYTYEPVSATTHTQFLNSESKGKYFAANIKGNPKYTSHKIGSGGGLSAVKLKTSGRSKQAKIGEDRTIEELSRDFHKMIRGK